MSTHTAIEWTDRTWNPVRGCSLVSAGCANCYAMKQAHRFAFRGADVGSDRPGTVEGPYHGLTRVTPHGPVWNGQIKLIHDALEQPLRWKKPRRVFVNSMSDLFHEDVPDRFIAAVFGVMAACQQHIFQILTKRPERMRLWFEWIESMRPEMTVSLVKLGGAWPKVDEYSAESAICAYCAKDVLEPLSRVAFVGWPLPNVHLGVSVEDQATADERIPMLLQAPAAVRFVSAEPLLGPIDLTRFGQPYCVRALSNAGEPCIHWVIVGGESGTSARPCDVAWIRSIRDQCKGAGVPVFVKQLGDIAKGWCVGRLHDVAPAESYEADHCDLYEASEIAKPCAGRCGEMVAKKGSDMSEWPEDLRVREFPEVQP